MSLILKLRLTKKIKTFSILRQTIDAIILKKIKIAIFIEFKNHNLSINYIAISNICINKKDIYCQNISKNLIIFILL